MKNESQPTKQNSSSTSTSNTESPLNQDLKQKSQSSTTSGRSPIAEADKIVNHSRETRDKDYGGFTASMHRTAILASELCNKEITTDDAFKMLMALKLSRLSYSPDHFDSFTDLMGYAEGWWKYREEFNEEKQRKEKWDKLTNRLDEIQEPPHPHHKAKTIAELHPKINSLFPYTEEQARERNAPAQGASAEKLEHLMKVTAAIQLLSGEGYRIFGPELTPKESMDWKDQQSNNEHYTDFIK